MKDGFRYPSLPFRLNDFVTTPPAPALEARTMTSLETPRIPEARIVGLGSFIPPNSTDRSGSKCCRDSVRVPHKLSSHQASATRSTEPRQASDLEGLPGRFTSRTLPAGKDWQDCRKSPLPPKPQRRCCETERSSPGTTTPGILGIREPPVPDGPGKTHCRQRISRKNPARILDLGSRPGRKGRNDLKAAESAPQYACPVPDRGVKGRLRKTCSRCVDGTRTGINCGDRNEARPLRDPDRQMHRGPGQGTEPACRSHTRMVWATFS